jgi:hypothetical protein
VDPSAGVDDLEKRKLLTLPGLELRPLSRPAHSQSLYRLCYRDTYSNTYVTFKVSCTVKRVRNFLLDFFSFWT